MSHGFISPPDPETAARQAWLKTPVDELVGKPLKAVEQRYAANEKPSNPKDSMGIKKVPMSAVSAPVIAELGLAMLEGALKYGRHNYRTVGVRASVYYDAALRHLMAWWEGEDIDPDSGLSHLVKAMACMAVIRDSMIQGNWSDDRPPKSPADWIGKLNKRAGEMIEAAPNPKPAHTDQDRLVGILKGHGVLRGPLGPIPVHAIGDGGIT